MKITIKNILKPGASFLTHFSGLLVAIAFSWSGHAGEKVEPFSSEISPKKIGQNILEVLSTAQERIFIASDKCTNQEFLDDLLGFPLIKSATVTLEIITGEDRATENLFQKTPYNTLTYRSIPSLPNGEKMHNKFIVVDQGIIITGSPNLTYAAYNYNIESFVAIYSEEVAELYISYFHYLKDQRQEGNLKSRIEIYNSKEESSLKICLAPLLDICQFVIERLNEAQIININMFLISGAEIAGGDIIEHLCRASQAGANVTIKVDDNQYERQQNFMEPAAKRLTKKGIFVRTVLKDSELIKTKTKKIKSTPQFHDKLILIEYLNGKKRVIIGSAGFTTNVQKNLNFENMVSIDSNDVYDLFLRHFNSIENQEKIHVEEVTFL